VLRWWELSREPTWCQFFRIEMATLCCWDWTPNLRDYKVDRWSVLRGYQYIYIDLVSHCATYSPVSVTPCNICQLYTNMLKTFMWHSSLRITQIFQQIAPYILVYISTCNMLNKTKPASMTHQYYQELSIDGALNSFLLIVLK